MRPVERGPCPTDTVGKPIRFREYGHAKPHLKSKLGEYCSYCEIPLPSSAHVEHIRHKHKNPGLVCEWDNFLLACQSCNSTKGTKVDSQADVDARLWPHKHRTFDVFIYGPEGVVHIATINDSVEAARAKATEEMVHLTRRPGSGLTREQVLRGSDNRWKKRKEAWDEAAFARKQLERSDTPEMRRQILKTAHALGFWSVWMTVFHDDPNMQQALCGECFEGTALDRVHPIPSHARRPVSNQMTGVPQVE